MKHLIKELSVWNGRNWETLTDMSRNLEVPVRNFGWRPKTSPLRDSRQHTGGYAVEASLPLINAVEERLQTCFQSFPPSL